MTFARCRTCRGLIRLSSNRCMACGRLDNLWNAIAARLRGRRSPTPPPYLPGCRLVVAASKHRRRPV